MLPGITLDLGFSASTVWALGILVCVSLLYACWRVFRNFILPSPLDNIPGPAPTSWFTGSLSEIFTVDSWGFHKEISEKYGAVIRLKGLLGSNVLYIYDPLALNQILVKDADVCEVLPHFIEGSRLMFGRSLAGTLGKYAFLGEEHRKQRRMLNPVFATRHLREMVPQFYETAHKLEAALIRRVADGPQEIEISAWFARIALEMIAQCGFGVSFDPLEDDKPPHPYAVAIKKVLPASGKMWIPRTYLLHRMVKIGPPKFRRWLIDITPSKNLHIMRDVIDMAHKTSSEIYESKKKALESGDESIKRKIKEGKDVISILMRANMKASEDERLTKEEVIAQITTLSFTGTDTTSSALSRLIWLMCEHQDVQERLRAELTETMGDGDSLPFEVLDNLPYLEAVVREALRLWVHVNNLDARYLNTALDTPRPPYSKESISVISYRNRKEILIPLYTPIKSTSGTPIHSILVPKNTTMIMSILSSNRNKAIWGEDAYEYKPDRWLNPLPESVRNARYPGVYSNLMTFLAGPRSCIGVKFTQLEIKVVLSLLVSKFKMALPKGVHIFWNNGTLALPVVVGGPPGTKLPVIFQLVKKE